MTARPSATRLIENRAAGRSRRSFGSVVVEQRERGAVAAVIRAQDASESMTTIEIVASGSIQVIVDAESGETANPGDALVLSPEFEGALMSRNGATSVSVSLPSSLLPDVVLSSRLRRIDGARSQLLRPIREFVQAALDASTARESGFADYYFERLLQEMILGLLVDAHRSWSAPSSPEVFTFALSVIAAQSTDPDLTAAGVAHEVHLSPRQLQRVFQARGTTIEREIRREKVEHAVDLLRNRQYDQLSIGEIARDAGFAAGSSLARAMAATGFPSPGEVRRRAKTRYSIRQA